MLKMTDSSVSTNNNDCKPAKCKLDETGCVSLYDILKSFNAPISEEHVWALCYQCAKCIKNCYSNNRNKCRLVKKLDNVIIHKDGYVHNRTVWNQEPVDENVCELRKPPPSEQKMLIALSYVIFQSFDFGMEDDEERTMSPQLEKLLNSMIDKGGGCSNAEKTEQEQQQQHAEMDDEGIEKDSDDSDEDTSCKVSPEGSITLDRVLQLCASHVGATDVEEADAHYRAVCRALVAEALELSSFLEKVSESGTNDLRQKALTVAPSEALDCLNFQDWAHLWIQVIRELRQGVNLKKVIYSRTPIEYELTPYEILMEDIRSRRYKLNKVMVDGNIPAPVKRDAHAIILEFIRSRPPLRKASERKLPPPKSKDTTPREKLLESIKQGNIKLKRSIVPSVKRIVPYDVTTPKMEYSSSFQNRQGSTRRLIKVDFSLFQDNDDDDGDFDENISNGDINKNHDSCNGNTEQHHSLEYVQNPMYRTGIVGNRLLSEHWDKSLERRPTNCSSSISLNSASKVFASCTII